MGNRLNRMTSWLGQRLSSYLSQRLKSHEPTVAMDLARYAACLRAADVLLVEGDTRLSVAIKYLTQSTWSHAALYVGPEAGLHNDAGEPLVFIEADVAAGVRALGMDAYRGLHCRICRPVGLTGVERRQVVDYARSRLGHRYDLKNVIDLARFLFPTPPVPVGWRRRMLNLGSGDPTRAICSTLIAQCFDAVKYPILPQVETVPDGAARDGGAPRAPSSASQPLCAAGLRCLAVLSNRQADVDAGVRLPSSGLGSRGGRAGRCRCRGWPGRGSVAGNRRVIVAGSGEPLAVANRSPPSPIRATDCSASASR